MNKAEFKTLREVLGFSQTDLARFAGVQDRTVRRWESVDYDNYNQPEDVINALNALDLNLDNAAMEAVVTAKTSGDKSVRVDLHRFKTNADLWEAHPDMKGLSTSTHAVLLFRAKRLLEKSGFKVEIHYLHLETAD